MERFFESFDLWKNTDPTCYTLKDWEFIGNSLFTLTSFTFGAGDLSGKSISTYSGIGLALGLLRRAADHKNYLVGFDLVSGGAQASTRQCFSSRNNGVKHLQVLIDTTGTLVFQLNSTVLYTHTSVCTSGQWYYVELEHIVDPTSGKINIWIDDVLVFNTTGNTQDTGANAFISSYEIFDTEAHPAFASIDNFYYLESNGTTPRLGPILIETLLPTADINDTTTSGWSYTGASSAFDALNDLYSASGPSATATVLGSQVKMNFSNSLTSNPLMIHDVLARMQIDVTDIGSTNLVAVVKANDNVWYDSSTFAVKSSTGSFYSYSFPLNPNGNVPWDVSSVEYADFGLRVVS